MALWQSILVAALLCVGATLAASSWEVEADQLSPVAAELRNEDVNLLQLDDALLRPSNHRRHRRSRHQHVRSHHHKHRFSAEVVPETTVAPVSTTAPAAAEYETVNSHKKDVNKLNSSVVKLNTTHFDYVQQSAETRKKDLTDLGNSTKEAIKEAQATLTAGQDQLNTKLTEEIKSRGDEDAALNKKLNGVNDELTKLTRSVTKTRTAVDATAVNISNLQARADVLKNQLTDLTKRLKNSDNTTSTKLRSVQVDLDSIHDSLKQIHEASAAADAKTGSAVAEVQKSIGKEIGAVFDPLALRVEKTEIALKTLTEAFTNELDRNNKRFDTVDGHLTKHSTRMSAIQGSIGRVSQTAKAEAEVVELRVTDFLRSVSADLRGVMQQVYTLAKNYHTEDEKKLTRHTAHIRNLTSLLNQTSIRLEGYNKELRTRIQNEAKSRMSNITYHDGVIAKLDQRTNRHTDAITVLATNLSHIDRDRKETHDKLRAKVTEADKLALEQQKKVADIAVRVHKLEYTVPPTQAPTGTPTHAPSAAPTHAPSAHPTQVPTFAPTFPVPVTSAPTTATPTSQPTAAPTPALTNVCEGRRPGVVFLEEAATESTNPFASLTALQSRIGGQWSAIVSRVSGLVSKEAPCTILSDDKTQQIITVAGAIDNAQLAANGLTIGGYVFDKLIKHKPGRYIVARMNNIHAIAYAMPKSSFMLLHITTDFGSYSKALVGIEAFARTTSIDN